MRKQYCFRDNRGGANTLARTFLQTLDSSSVHKTRGHCFKDNLGHSCTVSRTTSDTRVASKANSSCFKGSLGDTKTVSTALGILSLFQRQPSGF